jgi:putative acyl-CoA dehydrogenase
MSQGPSRHTRASTHEVVNQPPPLENLNLYDTDTALREGLQREGGAWAEERVRTYGAVMGSAHTVALGFAANHNEPELEAFDRFGHRVDQVAFHPAWHELMGLAMEHAVHALPWREPRAGAHVARSAMHSMLSQVEAGHACPITMTFACVPTLRAEPQVADEWLPRVLATRYDPSNRPAGEKSAATLGMAMTEKQGGSDVRTNTTRAHAQGSDVYELVGHKWFCSAPMSDAFLTLALTGGPTAVATPSDWNGSRTSWEIARTPRVRWSTTGPGRGGWARKTAACAPSSRWSSTRVSTA